MKFSLTNNLSIRTRVMMRVWYSYILSIVFSPSTLRGGILGASIVLFVSLVSVPNILSNLLQVQVGAVPTYMWQTVTTAIADGEFLKLLTLGIIIFSLLSWRFKFNREVVSPQIVRL